MGKLLKYELRKTWMLKLIVLGMTAAAEILFLVGLWTQQERALGLGVLLLSLLAMGSIMVIGLYSLVVLHRDMNTKQSYMLFMTPNSSYKILGAKVLENGLSMLLAGAAFFAGAFFAGAFLVVAIVSFVPSWFRDARPARTLRAASASLP